VAVFLLTGAIEMAAYYIIIIIIINCHYSFLLLRRLLGDDGPAIYKRVGAGRRSKLF